jgi:hypothetical protein
MDPEVTANAAATQRLIAQMNEHLVKISDAMGDIREALLANVKLAAMGQDTSYLAVRAMAEINPDFRTLLIRLAQEPVNEMANESRGMLLAALAEQHRNSGERPKLTPVPPKT